MFTTLNISSPRYVLGDDNQPTNVIEALIDGKVMYISADPRNPHYQAILRDNITILPGIPRELV